ITRVLRARGRFRQSLEESSFDAWIKFYKPDANASNATISYYTKGSLVALALDLTIRRETDSRHSLDSVMRACWARFGETGEGMPERGLESVAQSVTGLDLQEFFERYVRGTSELPLAKLLRDFGIRMHLRPSEGAEDIAGQPGSSGQPPPPRRRPDTAWRHGSPAGGPVHPARPAEAAGRPPGGERLAGSDVRVVAADRHSRLREYHAGDRVTLTAFRHDELLRCRARLTDPPEDTCWLEPDRDASAEAEARQRAWLA